MPTLINWNIVSNPANWLIIFLVLYLVALIAQLIYSASQGNSLISLPPGL